MYHFLIDKCRSSGKDKQDLLQEQVNKINEVIKVLTEQVGEDFEDEVNFLEIVKGNINESIN